MQIGHIRTQEERLAPDATAMRGMISHQGAVQSLPQNAHPLSAQPSLVKPDRIGAWFDCAELGNEPLQHVQRVRAECSEGGWHDLQVGGHAQRDVSILALVKPGSSERIEMKVEAHSAAPVPTEAMNSQP